MPSKHQPAARTDPRLTYEKLEADLGEDPARYLAPAVDLDPLPMIRGIEDFGRASAWLAVARDLDCSERVRAALRERREQLRGDDR